jgi:DNA-binding NarL/FixJ family response regulator
MSIRVLVVDDQTLVRAGFVKLLEPESDLRIVGEAADGSEAVDAAARARPDVVLMDIRMPRLDGLAATRRIGEDAALAGVRVVILTTFELDEYVFEAIRAGASGFLVKDTEPADLLQAIRVVERGDALLSPSVTRRLITDLATRPAGPTPAAGKVLAALTDREREVLALVAAGRSNGQIATALFISPKTASVHVSNILAKFGVSSRIEAAGMAHRLGLVESPPP